MKSIEVLLAFALVLAASLNEVPAQTIAEQGSVTVYRCDVDGVRYYKAHPAKGEICVAIAVARPSQRQLSGPPSILAQCLDAPTGNTLVGPSARARECTREYCAQQSYRASVSAYAMRRPQSPTDQTDALTCITRSEQDARR